MVPRIRSVKTKLVTCKLCGLNTKLEWPLLLKNSKQMCQLLFQINLAILEMVSIAFVFSVLITLLKLLEKVNIQTFKIGIQSKLPKM